MFEVAVVTWPDVSRPKLVWESFRRWVTQPDKAWVSRAQQAALGQTRFFRVCPRCSERVNAGHMCDNTECMACAEADGAAF